MLKLKHTDLRGETMIEVMIALMILGLVMGSSISLANKSLRGQQTAQERTEASNVAQSIVEIINMYARKDNPDVFDPAVKCVSTDFTADVINDTAVVNYDPTTPDPKCFSGLDNRYLTTVNISVPDPTFPNIYEYNVTTVWDGLDVAQNNVIMRYRFSRITP